MSDPLSPRRIAAFKRFFARMPHDSDVDLIILKAHLLIEEQVNEISRARLRNPDVLLGEDRFESNYRIRLAQSFFDDAFQPALWHALAQLNKLRNRVAHNIDPKGRENLMADIIKTINRNPLDNEKPLQERFEFSVWLLYEAVSSLVDPQSASVVQLVPRNPT